MNENADNNEFEPDIFDLNDWLNFHDPHFLKAIKYNSNSSVVYKIMLDYWKKAGKPDIDEYLAGLDREAD